MHFFLSMVVARDWWVVQFSLVWWWKEYILKIIKRLKMNWFAEFNGGWLVDVHCCSLNDDNDKNNGEGSQRVVPKYHQLFNTRNIISEEKGRSRQRERRTHKNTRIVLIMKSHDQVQGVDNTLHSFFKIKIKGSFSKIKIRKSLICWWLLCPHWSLP